MPRGCYSRARYYHPGLQRFISEDPIGFAGRDSNLYAYVANAPLDFTDPLGLEIIGGTVGAGAFGGFGQVRPGAANFSGTFNLAGGSTRVNGCTTGTGWAASAGTGITSWRPADEKGGSAYGLALSKLGPGAFWSNANSFSALAGPFDTTIVTAIGVTVQVDRSREGNTTVVSVSPGLGLGFATLTTNTFATAESPTAPRCPNSAIIPASLAIIPASPAGIPASLAGRK